MKPGDRWRSFLGLAQRAGRVVSGEDQVLAAIRGGQAAIVLLSEDASPRTTQTMRNKTHSYGVPLKIVADRYTLGGSIGKEQRVVVAVNDRGFAKKLTTLLDQSRG